MVNHYIPSTLSEALEVLSQHDCYIMAGGTDLMVVKHRSSGLVPGFDKDVCYISNLKELQYINKDNEGAVHIGAGTKYVDIEQSEIVPELIRRIVRDIAATNVRNMATMAGNIGNASPAGDSLVGLYLLDASIVLASVRGERTMPLKEFITGVRRTRREKDELIKEIVIPNYDGKTYWKKVGSRAAESISKCTFAGGYKVEDGIVKDIRFAFGSVSITVVRKEEIENEYKGLKINEFKQKIPQILDNFAKFITPISDQRSTKDYRFKVEMNMFSKFLENIE